MATIEERIGKKGTSYRITVENGRDSDNKRIRPRMTYTPKPGMSKREIASELNRTAVEFETRIKQGIYFDSRMKFCDYAKYWMSINKENLEIGSYAKYEYLLVRINQGIGHIQMDRLQVAHLQLFYKSLREIVSEKTGKKLSDQTILHYHRYIATVLAQATREGVIPRNIAGREFIKAPKVKKKEPRFLDDNESRRFIDCIVDEDDIRHRTVMYIFIYTGFRIGELTGLEWQDIDYENKKIYVRRTSQYKNGYGLYTKEPKNEESIRTITISDDLIPILKDYNKWYNRQRLMHGDIWPNSNRLFITNDGSPIYPGTINKWLNKFCEKHGFNITPHSLRHTNITLQITHGVDIRTAAGRAGHSRSSTTLDMYSHAIKSADEHAAQTLNDILSPTKHS